MTMIEFVVFLIVIFIIVAGAWGWGEFCARHATVPPPPPPQAYTPEIQFGGWMEAVPWGGELSGGAYIEDRLYNSLKPGSTFEYDEMRWVSGVDERLVFSAHSAAIGLPIRVVLDARYASYQPILNSAYELYYDYTDLAGNRYEMPVVDELVVQPGQYRFHLRIKSATAQIIVYGLTIKIG